ncbi:MAG: hypothetical protein K6G90_12155 [Clostridia bacterium]|nr:hypothetical protein [Clostridia bacterium]
MKRSFAVIVLVLAVVLVFASCGSGTSGEEESTNEYSTGISAETASLIAEYTPDADGNFVTKTRVDTDGAAVAEYYDNDGKLIESHKWADGADTGHTLYTYNDDGDISVEESFGSDGKPDSVVQYNYSDGTLAGSSRTTYSDGASTGSEYYNSEGKLTQRSEYEYDGTKLMKITRYDAEDNMIGSTTYKYNKKGYIVKVSEFDEDGNLSSYSALTYDKSNNIVRTDYYDKDDNLTVYMINEYNENGKRVSTTRYDADGNVLSVDNADNSEESSITG